MSYETFLQDLHAVRDRAGRFRRHARAEEADAAALALALEELDVTLEELRVAEEEVLLQQEALGDGRAERELDRQHLQALFLLAPAAYLVTDPVGVIGQANLRAAGLLGVDGRFLAGKPLASFVDPDDRSRFRDHLSRLPGGEGGEWRVRLRPRDRDPVQVVASVAVGRDHAGLASELRWLLWPPLADEAGAGRPEGVAAAGALAGAAAGMPALDDLAEALHEVTEAAALLLGADGAGLMLADQAGVLRWVTATGEAEQAFERAQRDLGEGPCVDAFGRDTVVWTADLRSDPRWPRLGPAGAGNHVRGVLAVPVGPPGRRLGTVNAMTRRPRPWSGADAAAAAALAAVVGRLLGSAGQARHRGDLVVQLQGALDSRILVEQAKGVLMEREGLSAQGAFERLRRQARARSRKVDEVAREVIAGRAPPRRDPEPR
jgi:PAS domain-containing protein